MRKGKNKAEEDLDNLKTYYKKLCFSIRTTRCSSSRSCSRKGFIRKPK
ncbi:hypothetical protein Gogos_008889 [Gossypium gossypioides]|uniref:Uncharacterized protein n=1 Tax=Gossypium gossypioides TaxID=34282 RepID=A0A7J9CCY7_GOSGO|nr:hypothetical protein [Gossypium gossypioides]